MNLLSNKTAIITGASRGIGRAIAIEFAKEGANIAFTTIYRDEDVDSLEKELFSIGVKYKFYEVDARHYSRAIEIANNVEEDFSQIDILVNNAGIGNPNLLMLMKEEQWDTVIGTNLKSAPSLRNSPRLAATQSTPGAVSTTEWIYRESR